MEYIANAVWLQPEVFSMWFQSGLDEILLKWNWGKAGVLIEMRGMHYNK